MAEEWVTAYCSVYNGIHNQGLQILQCITPEILKSYKFAHSRYMTHEEENKKAKQANKKDRKRKSVGEELNPAQRKKHKQ